VASGTVNVVEHVGTSASGNLNITGTLTPDHVVLEDASGNLYSGLVYEIVARCPGRPERCLA